jgi:Iap family predicted aminopeptidase
VEAARGILNGLRAVLDDQSDAGILTNIPVLAW